MSSSTSSYSSASTDPFAHIEHGNSLYDVYKKVTASDGGEDGFLRSKISLALDCASAYESARALLTRLAASSDGGGDGRLTELYRSEAEFYGKKSRKIFEEWGREPWMRACGGDGGGDDDPELRRRMTEMASRLEPAEDGSVFPPENGGKSCGATSAVEGAAEGGTGPIASAEDGAQNGRKVATPNSSTPLNFGAEEFGIDKTDASPVFPAGFRPRTFPVTGAVGKEELFVWSADGRLSKVDDGDGHEGIVVCVDGVPILTNEKLAYRLSQLPPGETAALTVVTFDEYRRKPGKFMSLHGKYVRGMSFVVWAHQFFLQNLSPSSSAFPKAEGGDGSRALLKQHRGLPLSEKEATVQEMFRRAAEALLDGGHFDVETAEETVPLFEAYAVRSTVPLGLKLSMPTCKEEEHDVDKDKDEDGKASKIVMVESVPENSNIMKNGTFSSQIRPRVGHILLSVNGKPVDGKNNPFTGLGEEGAVHTFAFCRPVSDYRGTELRSMSFPVYLHQFLLQRRLVAAPPADTPSAHFRKTYERASTEDFSDLSSGYLSQHRDLPIPLSPRELDIQNTFLVRAAAIEIRSRALILADPAPMATLFPFEVRCSSFHEVTFREKCEATYVSGKNMFHEAACSENVVLSINGREAVGDAIVIELRSRPKDYPHVLVLSIPPPLADTEEKSLRGMGYAVWMHQYLKQRARGDIALENELEGVTSRGLLVQHRTILTEEEIQVQQMFLARAIAEERTQFPQSTTDHDLSTITRNEKLDKDGKNKDAEEKYNKVETSMVPTANVPSPQEEELSLRKRLDAITERNASGLLDQKSLEERLQAIGGSMVNIKDSSILDGVVISATGDEEMDLIISSAADQVALDQKYTGGDAKTSCLPPPCGDDPQQFLALLGLPNVQGDDAEDVGDCDGIVEMPAAKDIEALLSSAKLISEPVQTPDQAEDEDGGIGTSLSISPSEDDPPTFQNPSTGPTDPTEKELHDTIALALASPDEEEDADLNSDSELSKLLSKAQLGLAAAVASLASLEEANGDDDAISVDGLDVDDKEDAEIISPGKIQIQVQNVQDILTNFLERLEKDVKNPKIGQS